jgi:voltage-gated potassium channel
LGQYERRTEWPMIGLAIAFLASYAWPILDQGLSGGVVGVLGVCTLVVWALFAVDYLVRLYLSASRVAFVRRHLFDLLMVVVPVFRPLRALRIVPVLLRMNERATASFRGRVVTYVAGAVVLTLFVAALAVLDAERSADNANIVTFGDALWWATTTATTVGYGDLFPVTTEGRWVAVGLMVAGIALIGLVTAGLAAWFVERLSRVQQAEDETRAALAELAAEVRALRGVPREDRDGG